MDLDLEALVVAGDGSVNLTEHGEGVAELHVAGERGEGVIGAAVDVGDQDGAFEDGDGFFEASEAAVDGGEDVEAHGEVEAGLALDGAALKGSGGPDGEVEGLGGAIARGNGVAGQLEKEWAEIRVVQRGIGEKWGFLFGGARRGWGGCFLGNWGRGSLGGVRYGDQTRHCAELLRSVGMLKFLLIRERKDNNCPPLSTKIGEMSLLCYFNDDDTFLFLLIRKTHLLYFHSL